VAVDDVDPTQALALIEEGAFLLDVRQPDEWDAGHAPMATLISLSELPDHLDDLPKDRVIVSACRSGGRSLRAAAFLDDHGFEVVNLAGGMIAWHEADLPFVADHGEATIS